MQHNPSNPDGQFKSPPPPSSSQKAHSASSLDSIARSVLGNRHESPVGERNKSKPRATGPGMK